MFDLVLHRDRDVRADVHKLEERLNEVEKKAKPPAGKSGWEILQIIGGVLSPIVLALLAFFLTGKITLALQKRQVDLAAGKEIKELMGDAITAETPEKASAAAVGLAAYGEISVPPLTYLLRSQKESVSQAAVEGLRAVTLTHSDLVCKAMKNILENRTRIYTWENHRTAVEFIGQLQCHDGRAWLQHYDAMLQAGKVAELTQIAAPYPVPNEAALANLRTSVQNALKAFP